MRQRIELLEQSVVEVPTALISGKSLVPIGGCSQRVPAHEHGTRPLSLVEAQQGIRKADDGAGAFATPPENGLRQAVI
jgi:hypothetical protein